MLDSLQLHFQGLGPLTRQDIFTLVGVVLHHLRDSLLVRQVTDDTGHIREARKLAGLLTAVARHDLIAAVLTGTNNSGLGHALVPDAGHHSLHFLVITDLERMIFEGVEVRQFQVNNLFLLRRAGSLGGGRGCFSLNRSLCLGRTLGGLGGLGGLFRFLGGSGLLRRLALLAGGLLLCGSGGLGLILLGRAAPALLGLFLHRPGLFGRRRGSGLFWAFRLLLDGGLFRRLLLGHDFREVKDRYAGGLLLLGSVCGLVLLGGGRLFRSFGLIRGGRLGSRLLLLGGRCAAARLGLCRGRASVRPGCVSYDFFFFIGHSHFLLLF